MEYHQMQEFFDTLQPYAKSIFTYIVTPTATILSIISSAIVFWRIWRTRYWTSKTLKNLNARLDALISTDEFVILAEKSPVAATAELIRLACSCSLFSSLAVFIYVSMPSFVSFFISIGLLGLALDCLNRIVLRSSDLRDGRDGIVKKKEEVREALSGASDNRGQFSQGKMRKLKAIESKFDAYEKKTTSTGNIES